MEIIIGREEGVSRLHCIADGREFNVGQADSVPQTVSRKHCKLTINGNNITIENLKPQNITFVDGNQIFTKSISSTSKVQLSNERFTVPLQQILQLATGKPVVSGAQGAQQPQTPTFSLRPMKSVWEEYESRKLDIQNAAAKSANRQRLQGILSLCASCVCFIPGMDDRARIFILVAALAVALYFFFKGQTGNSVQQQINELDKEYAGKYKCPNPACGKPFGYSPYHMIEFNKQCFACGCKYTH